MTHNEELIDRLERITDTVRRNVITIFEGSQLGHTGGTMSIVEIITALYFHHMKIDPKDFDWQDRDRLILSKAHSCEAIYAALAEIGWIPKEKLNTYCRYGSPLQGHADRAEPQIVRCCRQPGCRGLAVPNRLRLPGVQRQRGTLLDSTPPLPGRRIVRRHRGGMRERLHGG